MDESKDGRVERTEDEKRVLGKGQTTMPPAKMAYPPPLPPAFLSSTRCPISGQEKPSALPGTTSVWTAVTGGGVGAISSREPAPHVHRYVCLSVVSLHRLRGGVRQVLP